MQRRVCVVWSVIVTVASASGCATMNHTESGAVVGTGFGTALGVAIGSQTGNTGAGALIGAGVGALTGAAIGNAEDAREEVEVARAAQWHQATHMLTNGSLVQMTQNKVGDEVIIGAVRQQGGQFDLTPNAIIGLKSQGVSERVIEHVQTHSRFQPGTQLSLVDGAVRGPEMGEMRVMGPALPATTVVYAEPPPPRMGVYFGTGPVYWGPPRRWHGPGPRW